MKRMATLGYAAAVLGFAAAVCAVAQSTDPPASTTATPTAEQSMHLASLMPPGMSGQEACTGFRAVSECAAALHAAHNLSIAFADLKARVTGGQTLSAAIHELKPDANASVEAGKAEEQARRDLRTPSG